MNFIAAPPMPFINSLSWVLFFTSVVMARYCRSTNRDKSVFISVSNLSMTSGAAACTRDNTALRPATGIESHKPGRTCSARSRAISSTVRVSGSELLDRLPGVDLVQNLLGSQQLVCEHLDGHRRGLTGAAWNDALPSKRPDADKLDRPVKHLQGNEFRCVAD